MGKYCSLCLRDFEDGESYYYIDGENVCDDCVRAYEDLAAIPIEELKKSSKTNYKEEDE